ncbi:unnamed protein product [Cuscuta campestris]|uniref:Reverse transcriptase domain-containing protein n=1 Tax=Cuscuta campestris TaxID=132261 RepID=A0A484ML72_9ASTE|nr:unnamed protein product [Cuscuta campestris]
MRTSSGFPLKWRLKTLWAMDPNSAAGLDGYNVFFFKHCWDIIKKELISACQEVWLGTPLPDAATSSNLVLIPKVDNPSSVHDFRPICLSTVAIKLASKCLANRLSKLLPILISEEQGAYMMGKDISEQILLTKEMVHNLDIKAWGGNIIVKLDLSKAFDKLKWSFLFDVLLRFGFSNRLIHIIHNLMNSSKYSVVVNGKPCGFFSQTRGIKQGDPLSPLLFIIANEAFSKNLNKLMNHGVIGRYNCGNNSIPISHLSYADDIIIFCNSSCKSLVNLKFFLKTYQECSGQNINKQKSSFFVGKFQNSRKIAELEKRLDMQHKKLPFTYLGISIDKGITRTQHCNQLITAFDRKLGSWQFKQLDQAGRLILINHVLNTLPIFFLGSSTLPKSVQNILKQKMSRFWWKSKHHWVNWEDICTPKEEGGLGIRDLSSLQDSFSLKLWWNYHSNTSLWAKFMHAKYERDGEMEAHIIDSPVWKRIVEIDEIGVVNTTENEEGILNWEQTSDKLFSLSSAYDICRVSRPTCRYFMYIWGKGQNPKVSIFLWKLFKKALPIPENLERLGFHLPSVCFLCHNGPYTASHCLLECQQFASCATMVHTQQVTVS